MPDWRLHQRLIVLADTVPTKDGGHRGVPLWLRVYGHKELLGRVAQLSRLGHPAADAEVASGLLETAVRLLRTAGTAVSAVDIEPASDDVPELRWDTVTARLGLATATFLRQGTGLDYSATTEDGRAILAAAVPEPAGFAFLAQEIEPDDYRGRTVTFRGELRTDQADGRAGLVLRVTSPGRSTPSRTASPDPREDPANHIAAATGTGAWTRYEVTAQIPADASLITFGAFLNGGGQLQLRHPALAPHPPGQQ